VDVHLVDLDAHDQAKVLLRVLHPLAATDNIYQAVNQYLLGYSPVITHQPSHCNEDPIYVFLFWELPSLSPNFHIHVSVSNLYFLRIGPHISSSRIGRSNVGIYKSLMDTCMWKLGLWLRNFFSGNICFQFSVLVLCSAYHTFIYTRIF
jgi:hypothetical protein